ncbi:hypothetical protein SO802_031429 [Lithocarpus litseifolius]|uniref:Transmembrane protein n=1 Tax=Lithocarpus litseifolius TaxID=425828 RepID=A0AAW2BM79_9ROSI
MGGDGFGRGWGGLLCICCSWWWVMWVRGAMVVGVAVAVVGRRLAFARIVVGLGSLWLPYGGGMVERVVAMWRCG